MGYQAAYWGTNGKYQTVVTAMTDDLIPASGSVDNPRKNRKLEKLRKAINCYYDLFNNGLCNRASEFRSVFGFGGSVIAKVHHFEGPLVYKLDQVMDDIIVQAAVEQGGKYLEMVNAIDDEHAKTVAVLRNNAPNV